MQTLTREQFESKYGKAPANKLAEMSSTNPNQQYIPSVAKKPLANQITDTLGLGGATDVFGRLLARQGIGTDVSKDVTQEFVEAPTGKEIAGAVAQTASIPAGIAITGGSSLPAQILAGGTLGYVYDVGADFAEGKEGAEAFQPGVETLAGTVLPVGLRGLGAGVRGVGTAITRGKQATQEGVEMVGDSGIGQRVQEFAGKIPRAFRRVGEYIDEGKQIAERKKTGTPQVVNALNEDISLDTIDFVQKFDEPTRKLATEMMDLAEAGRGANLPQTIPGRVAGNQLDLVEKQRKNIGNQIGEFSDALSTQKTDITPSVRDLRILLNKNGIKPFADGLEFENKALTPKQQNVISEMYKLATQNTELSPKQIHQMDQLFSKLQREARFEGVDDVFIEVPTPDGQTQTNIYKVFRDIFSQRLDQIAEEVGRGDIKELNRQYRTLRNLQDNVESTIVRQSKLDGINVDPSESASVALRRLFSNATSRAEYQEVYNQLDATSRALGYDGARADTLMDFYLTDMKPLYPESVPKASFEGGIRGAVSGIVDTIQKVGAPNAKDQQKALRSLLTDPAITPDQAKAMQGLGERLSESSESSVSKILKNNKQAGFAFLPIGSKTTPESVAKLMDDNVFDAFAYAIEDLKTAKTYPEFNRLLQDMKLNRASDEELVEFLKEATDEYEKLSANKS